MDLITRATRTGDPDPTLGIIADDVERDDIVVGSIFDPDPVVPVYGPGRTVIAGWIRANAITNHLVETGQCVMRDFDACREGRILGFAVA